MQRHLFHLDPHPASVGVSSLSPWQLWLYWLGWTIPIAIGLFVAIPVSAQAESSEFSLTAGFASRRVSLPERVALQQTEDCGYIPAEPIATVTLEEDFFYLNFNLLDATPETTLLVVSLDHNGDRFCSRGGVGQSGYWRSGTYTVYIGGVTEQAALTKVHVDGLEISETP